MRQILIAFGIFVLSACGSNGISSSSSEADQVQPIVEFSDRIPEAEFQSYLDSENPYVRRAAQLKKDVDEANRSDIELLLKGLDRNWFDGEFDQRLQEKLAADKQLAASLLASLYQDSGRQGTISLRSNLGKLLSSGGERTGIYDDAHILYGQLKDDLRRNSLGDFAPRYNEITVLKTLLIYMHLVGGDSPFFNLGDLDLQLLYEDAWPSGLANSGENYLGLFEPGDDVIRMPNAGYVYGGTMQEESCRGLDCSAMLSYATESERLTTMVMEYSWRFNEVEPDSRTPEAVETHIKARFDDETDQAIAREFWEQYNMKDATEKFAAIQADSLADLEPGDLVVWRWKSNPDAPRNTSGHVVMYLGRLEDGRMRAIEANRMDDKSVEGIVFSTSPLDIEDRESFVLRRR